ncbi:MAG TPA: cytochrome P450 [Acidimicrobiales bacterium]|nr:cytochrome P450 [Acidimicrobiales bacterium]
MIDFDPFDPAFFVDPYPSYAVMREEEPVYRREVPDHRVWPHYWMLTRADDVDAALADWRRFSSARGTLVDTDITLIPPNMFNMDPPRHDELRSALSRVLTPNRITDLEPHVRAYAEQLARGFGKEFDAATDFAQPIPTITMCALMDLPVSERDKFLKWNLDTLAGADFTSPQALQAYAEMGEYWQGLVEQRRKSPGPDLISQILQSEVELSDEEVAGFCSLLHDASQNTTMNMIALGVTTLARYPDERRRLRDDRSLWPQALEELLRHASPVQGLARTTTTDVTLHGVTIPEGDQVLVLYGSANHDPSVYPEPERLDFGRDVKNHWVFGHGIHYCLGNAVARLEVRVALDVLLDTLGDWEADTDAMEFVQLVPTRCVSRAPVSTVS